MAPTPRSVRVRYYDLVLALIPSLFGLGWFLVQLAGLAMPFALLPVGVATAGLIAHALFVRPPVSNDAMGIEPGDVS